MDLLTVLKGLPLAYNKDMQEDKEGMFDTVKTVTGSLKIFAGMIRTMKVRTENMEQATKQDFSNATELADYLSSKGMPFREAHEVVGKLVLQCVENKCFLVDLSMDEFKQSSSLFENDIYEVWLLKQLLHGVIVQEEQDLNKLRLPLKKQKAV